MHYEKSKSVERIIGNRIDLLLVETEQFLLGIQLVGPWRADRVLTMHNINMEHGHVTMNLTDLKSEDSVWR